MKLEDRTTFAGLVRGGEVARAIALGRRLLLEDPSDDGLAIELARLLAARGDDDGAARALEGVLARPTPPVSALLLAAEVRERAGERVQASALYERVLAEDITDPTASARLARLRAHAAPTNAGGATLVVEGALARGRWRIERELGRGGAGGVFAAHDTHLDRTVALKVYHGRTSADRARLLNEGRVAAAFDHPGVIRVLDVDLELGALAMDIVEGGALRGLLRASKVDAARARRIVASLAAVLADVHAAGFVHRDIKPSNVLIRGDADAVLIDFGLALPTGAVPGAANEGTAGYIAPEQARGEAAAPAADVFALGVLLRDLGLTTSTGALSELAAAACATDPSARPSATDLAAVTP